KCDMCIDRVHNGMLPACVQACPTGTMNFGDREDMLKLAEASLAKAKKKHPKAVLVDAESVRTIYLSAVDPGLYHKFMMAEARPMRLFTRKEALASLIRPLSRMTAG
ncbi:MAG: formate dehydrogenase, partial [Desulfovibrionaceae bacterium]|nr:formate dehydrogenase [Desulfovibrionaceae bacterium]